MVAGVPGVGISGLYYLLLSFLMPVHELYELCRGRSSKQRWLLVADQLANAVGILGSLYFTSWVVRRAARWIAALFTTPDSGRQAMAVQQISAATFTSIAWVTMVVLASVVIGAITAGVVLSQIEK